MAFWNNAWQKIKDRANLFDSIDIAAADKTIRGNIYFRGPNVWILAFSIVVASVGLNINSTAVIIGAMLISPLLGPIFGIGMSLGINDTTLLKDGAKNLVVMVVISVIASFLYFLISPFNPINATELQARTNPTIFDVLIALFGGFAGIIEQCRKEKGTVLSGVAIATALMPPLCTAGYGLAHGNLSYFFGALFLFSINGVFIILASYLTVKYLKFPNIEYPDPKVAKRTGRLITLVTLLVIVPSIWSAFMMIRSNNFERAVLEFISDNKALDEGYIYDYKIDKTGKRKAVVFVAGEPLKATERKRLMASAAQLGIKDGEIELQEHSVNSDDANDSEKLMKGIYERTDSEINKREAQIRLLEEKIKKLSKAEIPYEQVGKEIASQYPDIQDLYITKGAEMRQSDSLSASDRLLVVAKTKKRLSEEQTKRLGDWLKIRLEDSTVVIINQY